MKNSQKPTVKRLVMLLFATALSSILIVSCSKTEESIKTGNPESNKKITRSEGVSKKSGGTISSYVCLTGSGPSNVACCPGPYLIEICGTETRDAVTNDLIDFNITSVRQITGNCLQNCSNADIMRLARHALVFFFQNGDEGTCFGNTVVNYIIKSPLCVKNKPGSQGLWKQTCDDQVYCEHTITATCIGGVLSITENTSPIQVGSCTTCSPIACEL